jgi:hypothetical protein
VRSISVCAYDLPCYGREERDVIEDLMRVIPDAFPPTNVQEEKGLIHKRRAWTCVNGHAVSAKEDTCGICTADRRGFEHGFMTPESAVTELARKLAVLDRQFAQRTD